MLYKKKKLVWIVVIGLIVVVTIGIVAYFVWPKDTKTNNYKQEVQQLQEQLSALKIKLNDLSDANQRTLLERKISVLESEINNLSNQGKQNKSTIKKLELELEKIEKRLNDDKPDNKKGGKFSYTGDEVVSGYYSFSNLDFVSPENKCRFIIVNKNHPQFKGLLSKGKLKVNKQFYFIRYGVPNRIKNKVEYYFDEDNEKLEIKEI